MALGLTLADQHPEHDPIVALVPAPILWAAAQFASTDPSKELLNCICLKTVVIKSQTKEAGDNDQYVGPGVEITSTDGHRLFRAVIPASDHFFGYADQIDNALGFKLQAKPLKKRVPYAHYALVSKSGRVELIGGKKAKAATGLPQENLSSVYASSHPFETACFPNCAQLIPDHYGQGTETPIAFNARYLAEFCSVVDKLSSNNVVKMRRNHRTTPAVFSCLYDLFSVGFIDLECLIMPVQIRD